MKASGKGVVNFDYNDIECVIGVHCFFNDSEKTAQWFNTPNPMLGGIRPMQMLFMGRGEKLKQWINNRLDENQPVEVQ